MSKHTPGPWRHEIDGPATNDMRHAVLSEHTGLWIAATYRSGTLAEDDTSLDADQEAKANAKLIAAAPDLLTALQAVLHWIDDNCETTGFEAVEALADAALEKAGAELFNVGGNRLAPTKEQR